MFLLEKIVSSLIISPTIFVILFIFIGLFSNRYNLKTVKKISLVFGIILYTMTIRPTVDITAKFVENIYNPANQKEITSGEVYVVLGGGITEGTPIGDLPSDAAAVRLMHTAILYNKNPKKIYISGGKVTNQKISESSVYKKILSGLNIPEEDIITESNSRTTMENAKYTSELLKKDSIKNIILVTSAGHMARSKMTFENYGFKVIAAPCGYIRDERKYNVLDFIPRGDNLGYLMRFMWEITGTIYYKVKGSI